MPEIDDFVAHDRLAEDFVAQQSDVLVAVVADLAQGPGQLLDGENAGPGGLEGEPEQVLVGEVVADDVLYAGDEVGLFALGVQHLA